MTKRGSVIYSVGEDALRDDGESFRIARAASLDTAIMALQLAKKRFGEPLHITGDSAFREAMVAAAVEGKVYVKFADPTLEAQRRELQNMRQQAERKGREAQDRGR